MRSCQNPLHLSGCYCYCYCFLGALPLSRFCDFQHIRDPIWRQNHPKSIPKQARKSKNHILCAKEHSQNKVCPTYFNLFIHFSFMYFYYYLYIYMHINAIKIYIILDICRYCWRGLSDFPTSTATIRTAERLQKRVLKDDFFYGNLVVPCKISGVPFTETTCLSILWALLGFLRAEKYWQDHVSKKHGQQNNLNQIQVPRNLPKKKTDAQNNPIVLVKQY